MKSIRLDRFAVFVPLFTACIAAPPAPAQFQAPSGPSPHPVGTPPMQITASSLIGDGSPGNHVKMSAILSDGSILIGGHFGQLPFLPPVTLVDGARPTDPWLVLRLTGDGRRVLGGLRFRTTLSDMVLCGREGVYIAAGEGGLFAFTPRLDRQVRHHADIGFAYRVDASPGGYYAVLSPSNVERRETNGGSGQIRVFNPMGEQIQQFGGFRNTLDLAIDETRRAVHFTGWRQDRSWQPDGGTRLPVQIAYIRSVGFDGTVRWTGYDWGVTRHEDNFINRGDNNMADTRGYRITLTPEGNLVVAFEVAGGNHIFRYSPHNITDRVTGRFARAQDHHHQFHNTRSEHKTFVGVYSPETGDFITGQQFTARLSNGRGNAWRSSRACIRVAENGQVWMATTSASGAPYTFRPATAPGNAGGALLHGMSPDLGHRDFGIYLGSGQGHTVSVRTLPGQQHPVIVWGGVSPPLQNGEEYVLHHFALQPRRNGETNGFFKVFNGRGGQQ